eukprot:TRINITY_DN4812_c0_g1_i1.p1 TRINITY_DN4812_c0_g1~~TRINITY_DN4812_c0_g1_i1.p1  ORF type:complete len:472 (-),score=130.45 TRINITY_DN4812_c0_g1_i1:27-1406(-)
MRGLQTISIFLILIFCLHMIQSSSNIAPKHIHISFGDKPNNYRIMWLTDEYAESYVYYGEDKLTKNQKGMSSSLKYGSGYIHYVELTNLSMGKRYYYKVGQNNQKSKKFYFNTKDYQSDHEFKFLAYGDMGSIYKASGPNCDTVCAEAKDADFVFHVGDMAYAFGNFTKWNMFFENIECMTPYIPYVISPGNRDEKQFLVERFAMPNNQLSESIPIDKRTAYWSKELGTAYVISLSILDDYKSMEDTQMIWLEKELQYAKKKIDDKNSNLNWIILFVHTPLYSSSDGHTGGNKELKVVLEPLMIKYGVTLGIYGDDHVYERTYPIAFDVPDTIVPSSYDYKPCFLDIKKPIHLLVGTGGIDLDGWTSTVPPNYSAFRELSNGFVKVSVQKKVINVKFVRTDKTVSDEFFIMKDIEFEGQLRVEEEDSISLMWIFPFLLIFIIIIFKNFSFFARSGKSKI